MIPRTILVSILIASILSLAFADEWFGKCKALVLEGGGDKGAYQAGVIREMYELLGKEASYDVISGVSAGAINGIGYSMFDKGQEEQSTQFISKHFVNKNQMFELI